MADTSIRCSGCDVRLRVPEGRTAVRCPKCGEKTRVPDLEEDDDAAPPQRKSRRSAADGPGDDDRPRPARRRSDPDEVQAESRPRRRSRDDEDEEDERPVRRAMRARMPAGDGPWLVAALGALATFLAAFGGAFLVNGTAGLPAGTDGPGPKLAGLGIGFLACLVVVPLGVLGVKNRRLSSKWGTEIQGGLAVALGMVQAVMGGLVAGIVLYGLVFALANGR